MAVSSSVAETALSFRGKRTQNNNTSLIKIDGVQSRKETAFYGGKRIAYIYKGKTKRKGTKFRVIWGKVRVHLGHGQLVGLTCALQCMQRL